jgi:hypothetical protein
MLRENLKLIPYIMFNKLLGRRRKSLLAFIFLFFVFCTTLYYILHSFQTDYDDKKFDMNAYKIVYDDGNVDTSNYLLDYSRVVERTKNLKNQLDQENSRIKIQQPNGRKRMLNKTEYLIYEYTKVIGVEKYCYHFRHDKNKQSKNDAYAKEQLFVKECPYTNCKFTCDSSKINQADVLVFHEGDLKKDMKQNKNYLTELNSKVRKRAKQIWLLYNDEVISCFHLN